jgi:ADP-ribose 1''-phosphate phosphatase
MITYIKDNLFFASSTQLLVHACNCKGMWRSGIAQVFRSSYTNEYYIYKTYCEKNLISTDIEYSKILGSSLIINRVGCLFTSYNESNKPDPVELIILNTRKGLQDLLSKTTMDIAMPKINSGLFKVPWEQTEAILKEFPNTNFYVYEGK